MLAVIERTQPGRKSRVNLKFPRSNRAHAALGSKLPHMDVERMGHCATRRLANQPAKAERMLQIILLSSLPLDF